MTSRKSPAGPSGRSETAPPFFPPAIESKAPFGSIPVGFPGSFPESEGPARPGDA